MVEFLWVRQAQEGCPEMGENKKGMFRDPNPGACEEQKTTAEDPDPEDPYSDANITAHVEERLALAISRGEPESQLQWIRNVLPVVIRRYRAKRRRTWS